MVKLINHNFGTVTYVSEDRLEKYLSAGFKLAEGDPANTEKKKPSPKRKAATKTEK